MAGDNKYWRGFARLILWPVTIVDNGTERTCHWFQRMTGLTNYWLLGKESIGVSFTVLAEFMAHAAGLKGYAWFTSHLIPGGWPWKIVAGAVIVNYLVDGAFYWKVKEQRAFIRLSHGLANPNKMNLIRVYRLLLLATCWIDMYLLALMIYFFLDSCDPLPPCKGKVREWWENRNKKLIPVEVIEQ
jgi:hypothetical protein